MTPVEVHNPKGPTASKAQRLLPEQESELNQDSPWTYILALRKHAKVFPV